MDDQNDIEEDRCIERITGKMIDNLNTPIKAEYIDTEVDKNNVEQEFSRMNAPPILFMHTHRVFSLTIAKERFLKSLKFNSEKGRIDYENKSQFYIPHSLRRDLQNFWFKYRGTDIRQARKLYEKNGCLIGCYAAIVFPVFLSKSNSVVKNDNPNDVGHFVVFVVYIDQGKIVMYDSLRECSEYFKSKYKNDKHILSVLSEEDIEKRNNEYLERVERKKVDRSKMVSVSRNLDQKEITRTSKENYTLLRVFHTIENFINACFVVSHCCLYENAKFFNGKPSKKKISNEIESHIGVDFEFYVDSYKQRQESLECGLYVCSFMRNFMLSWPMKNTTPKQKIFRPSLSLGEEFQKYSKISHREIHFKTEFISHSSLLAMMVCRSLGFMSFNNQPQTKKNQTIIPDTCFLFSNFSHPCLDYTNGKIDEKYKQLNSFDAELLREINTCFQLTCMNKLSIFKRSKFIFNDLQPNSFLSSIVVDNPINEDPFSPLRELMNNIHKTDTYCYEIGTIVWILPSIINDYSEKMIQKTSFFIKSLISSTRNFIIVIPGHGIQIVSRNTQGDKRFLDLHSIKHEFPIVYPLNYNCSSLDRSIHYSSSSSKGSNQFDLYSVVSSLFSQSDNPDNHKWHKAFASNDIFTMDFIESPPSSCNKLSWVTGLGWMPFIHIEGQK